MIIKTRYEIENIFNQCKVMDSEILEGEDVEFKEFASINALHNSKELAEEVSALANKNGGIIVIGIKDGSNVINQDWESQLVGFKKGDVLEIENRIQGKIKPSIDLKAEYHSFEGKDYLVIHVPSRRDTLISTSSGKTCIRDGRSSRPMAPDEIRIAVTSLQNYDWTSDIMDQLDINALDSISLETAYKDYCTRKLYTKDQTPGVVAFLEAIGATMNGKLSKAGLLLLGKKEIISTWLGTFEYRFTWKTRDGALLINDVWDSNLWDCIKRAKKHFNTCNYQSELEFKGKKYSVKEFDDNAFHEGFMNALVHRDYSIEGMVVVDYDSETMTITNPGTFYGGVTAENISLHQPRHRNKALAKLLMNFQLVDRAGMGVKRMGLGSLIYGRRFPTFNESFDTVEVSMSAETILPGIFVLTQKAPEKFGLIDLIIINSIYRVGVVSISDLTKRIKTMTNDPWKSIKSSLNRHDQLELCGTNDGIFIRAKPKYNYFFDIVKTFKLNVSSEKHVNLFDYLMEFKEASNEDITHFLKHNSAAHTSQFLKKAKYVTRKGNSRSAKWYLKE